LVTPETGSRRHTLVVSEYGENLSPENQAELPVDPTLTHSDSLGLACCSLLQGSGLRVAGATGGGPLDRLGAVAWGQFNSCSLTLDWSKSHVSSIAAPVLRDKCLGMLPGDCIYMEPDVGGL
jgi:hypothetical protein